MNIPWPIPPDPSDDRNAKAQEVRVLDNRINRQEGKYLPEVEGGGRYPDAEVGWEVGSVGKWREKGELDPISLLW
jgi:hypothetical protein